ncbi:MAG: glycosyltransferase family 2 protein [Chloroflexi bacterium]|nr:glycosyltransferase family 2 protein [Chloroflexota bacterium]
MKPSPMRELHTLDVVIPIYNEEDALPLFHRQLCQAIDCLDCAVRLYYVDDGSSDRTPQVLEEIAASDARVTTVQLSRNFGHQAALTAGLDLAQGEAVITLDGDGQHPPEMISQMLDLYRDGYDVVLTQRLDAQQPSLFKRLTSGIFYRVLNRIGDTRLVPGAADFRLMSRQVVAALYEMREYHRFLRGMVAWMGYPTVILPYQAPARLGGKSKYSLAKMVRLAMDATFSFSLVPLQIGIIVGLLFYLLAGLEAIYVLSLWLLGQKSVLAPGWSSLMFMILIVGGTLTTLLSFIGIYVGYIFQQSKGRPIYLARKIHPAKPETATQDETAAEPAGDQTAS